MKMNNTFNFSDEELNTVLKCIKAAMGTEPLSDSKKDVAYALYDRINNEWHSESSSLPNSETRQKVSKTLCSVVGGCLEALNLLNETAKDVDFSDSAIGLAITESFRLINDAMYGIAKQDIILSGSHCNIERYINKEK